MIEYDTDEEEIFIPAEFDKLPLVCKRHKKRLASVDLSKNSYRRLLCFECMKEENERIRNPMSNFLKNRYSIEDVISSKAIEDTRAKTIAYQEKAMQIYTDLERRINTLIDILNGLKYDIQKKVEKFIIKSSNSHLDAMITILAKFQGEKAVDEGENLEKYIKHFLAIEKESELKVMKAMHRETMFDLNALHNSLNSLQNNWRFNKSNTFSNLFP